MHFRRHPPEALASLIFIIALFIIQPVAAATENTVRGIVKAEAEATLSTELIARVMSTPIKAGDKFTKNSALITFDCSRYNADFLMAAAEARAARLTLAMNQALRERRAVGAHELAVAATKLEQADAQMQATKVRTDQCIINAPFDGQVVERLINEHEMPQPNAPLLKIVKDGDLELGLVIPSRWLVWIKPGLIFDFTVEETSTSHRARIIRIGAVVDPISRTINVEAALTAQPQSIRPGMSGTATFSPPKSALSNR